MTDHPLADPGSGPHACDSSRWSTPPPEAGTVGREDAWSAPGTRTSSWGRAASTSDPDVFARSLHGEIDFSRRDELAAVASAFESSGCGVAELDVTDVRFVDSTALAMMLRMRRTAETRGGRVVLVRPGRQLVRLLTVAGVAALFDLVGSDER